MGYDKGKMPKLSFNSSLIDVSLVLCCGKRQDYAERLENALWKDGNNSNHLINSYVSKKTEDDLYYVVAESRIGREKVKKYTNYLKKFKIGKKNIVKFTDVKLATSVIC